MLAGSHTALMVAVFVLFGIVVTSSWILIPAWTTQLLTKGRRKTFSAGSSLLPRGASLRACSGSWPSTSLPSVVSDRALPSDLDFGHASHARRIALQDRQRYPADVVRPGCRLCRVDDPRHHRVEHFWFLYRHVRHCQKLRSSTPDSMPNAQNISIEESMAVSGETFAPVTLGHIRSQA
jgi:hypothetical protein